MSFGQVGRRALAETVIEDVGSSLQHRVMAQRRYHSRHRAPCGRRTEDSMCISRSVCTRPSTLRHRPKPRVRKPDLPLPVQAGLQRVKKKKKLLLTVLCAPAKAATMPNRAIDRAAIPAARPPPDKPINIGRAIRIRTRSREAGCPQ